MLFLCRPPELGGPTHRADMALVWADERRQCPIQNPGLETTSPGRMCPLEINREHTRLQSGPHRRNPTRRWFTGFAEAILWRWHHLNPSNSNSLDRIHPDCVCFTRATTWLKIHWAAMSASTIQVLGFLRRHLECNYILLNRNRVHPHTPHPTLTPNVTTSVLFRIKYYQIGPRSTMPFLSTTVCYFVLW
jgi:hypothetical protein